MKKIIGVTPRINKVFETNAFSVYQQYFDAIIKAGGIPIMLPIAKKEDLEQLMDNIDGLLLTGGDDINPHLYNEKVTYSKPGELKEDENDFNLIEIALNKKIPILGICRGIQIINVYFGGNLYQDLLKQNVTNINHSQRDLDDNPGENSMIYTNNFIKGTLLHDIYGNEYKVNSFHHQAIKDVPKNFVISSRSTDGIIEAIEDLDKKIIAIQWHPERLLYDNKHFEVYKRFIDMC